MCRFEKTLKQSFSQIPRDNQDMSSNFVVKQEESNRVKINLFDDFTNRAP